MKERLHSLRRERGVVAASAGLLSLSLSGCLPSSEADAISSLPSGDQVLSTTEMSPAPAEALSTSPKTTGKPAPTSETITKSPSAATTDSESTSPSATTTETSATTTTEPAATATTTDPEPSTPKPRPSETAPAQSDTWQPSAIEAEPTDRSYAINCMVERCIALTFDDGPGNYTEQLLDYLDQYDVKATFFMVGQQVENHQAIARDVAQRGHQVGNHSYAHTDLTSITPKQAANDIWYTTGIISQVTGITPTMMRPPYGATNQAVVEAIGIPEVLWTVDTRDWEFRDSDYVANYVIDNAQRGDVVLMHDIHPTSVAAVPAILDSLTASGYQLVTVENLFGGVPPNGVWTHQALPE